MRCKSLIPVLMFGMATVYGCGGKPQAPQTSAAQGAPQVVIIEETKEYKGFFVGNGVSGTVGDENVKKRQAKARAMQDIAENMKVAVKALMEDYTGVTQSGSTAGNAQSDLQETGFTNAIRTLTDQVLLGAAVKQYELRPDGTIKALVLMPKDQVLTEMGTKIPEQIQRDALRVKLHSEDAQKRLDDAIVKMKADTQQ